LTRAAAYQEAALQIVDGTFLPSAAVRRYFEGIAWSALSGADRQIAAATLLVTVLGVSATILGKPILSTLWD
jgi:hypothetical protein